MKKIRFVFAAFAALMLIASCQDEKDLKPSGSDERSITSIKFEGQLGEAAVPEIIDAENGRIDVQIATALCEDMTKVKVEELVISYKATASVEVGGTLDLSSGVAEIVVTAESGKARTYKVYCDPFTEPLEGKYSVINTAMIGGIGDPSWGGIELIDPIEKKSWLFEESIANGTGPAASNDDYFEIKCTKINDDGSTEGTCTLYGGVDAKHWDCMYHLQYDLKSTFRTIPLGTSYWHKEYKADGAVIIFKNAATDKDTVGVCKILNETTTFYTKEFALEAGQQAFAFQLKGDYSWTDVDTFTDYTKFVRSPIALFVRIKKVDEIPAESMTEGTMGDLQVEDPGTDPDPGTDDPEPEPVDPKTLLTGTFKVASLKVLGAPGSTGMVEVKDKSWMWNSTINNEYDNELILKPTGINGNVVTASIYYGAGEDGEFWDHTLISEKNKLGTGAMDLSDNYDQLPHGVSTATIDLGTGVVTIGSLTAGARIPGDYLINIEGSFSNIKFSVPDNSFSLEMACTQYPTDQYTMGADWGYTDFDRFALRPYVYYMTFTKISEDNTIPEEGGDEPTDDGISGTYKVKSLMHVGGNWCNSAINLADKKICFNSSFDTEYDNLLVVQATGAADGNVSVSLDYQAGADNGYWDGKFVAQYNKIDTSTDMDLSHDLCALPHGKSTGLIDTSNGTLTIGTAAFKLATPGSYDLERSSTGTKGTITVPDGCIGLFIPCKGYQGEYTYDNSWNYSTFDRVACHPYIYAMIFEKK